MTINERIKHLRKDVLRLSQTEFATKLGMKQTGVSGFEQTGATVTDQTLKTICPAFNLREERLLNGTEPPLQDPDTLCLDDFAKEHGATDLELEILKAYFRLPEDVRKLVIDGFKASLGESPHPETPEELEEKFPPVEKDTQAG